MKEIFSVTNWDRFFLDQAQLIATKSKDPSTKVGAIIVDSNQRAVSQGYNGFPRGCVDKEFSREVKYLRTIHAEINSILFSQRDLSGCSIYVTAPCCAQCMAAIIQVGIVNVMCLTPENAFAGRWEASAREAEIMAKEVGIKYEVIRKENLI